MDVNTQFDTDRTAQFEAAKDAQSKVDARIASGQLVAVPGKPGYFRSTEGWDKNEVFNYNGKLLLPQHGLDTSLGKAALYTRQPEWHSVGTVIPAGLTDIPAVLKAGGCDYEVIQAPGMFLVNGELQTVEDSFYNYRSDTLAALNKKTVTSGYTPFQNHEGAQFLRELTERYDVVFETVGALNGGREVFITMRLPDTCTIDAEGINDPVELFLAWVNHHDGQGRAEVIATPWRIRCGNTNRFASRDAVTRWGTRHTKNGLERLDEARRTMGLALKVQEVFTAEQTELARTDFELDEFDKLLTSLWKPAEGEQTTRSANYAEKRTTALWERFGQESAQVGRTAYAAYNAVTGYLDHDQPRRVTEDKLTAARATAMVLGSDDELKTTAHRKLLTLARR